MSAIVRLRPWSLIRGLQEDVNHIFECNFDKNLSEWKPHVDITEQPDSYSVVADIPGVDPKEIDVSIEGTVLRIKGERMTGQKSESEGYTRIECSSGAFSRQITLPENIDANKVQAKSTHGVLELTIPKKQSANPIKIEVKGEQEK